MAITKPADPVAAELVDKIEEEKVKLDSAMEKLEQHVGTAKDKRKQRHEALNTLMDDVLSGLKEAGEQS